MTREEALTIRPGDIVVYINDDKYKYEINRIVLINDRDNLFTANYYSIDYITDERVGGLETEGHFGFKSYNIYKRKIKTKQELIDSLFN